MMFFTLLTIGALSLIPFLTLPTSLFASGALLLLTIFFWVKKSPTNLQIALVSTIGTFPYFLDATFWPIPLVAGIALCGFFFSFDWIPIGKCSTSLFLLGLLFIVLSSSALILWYKLSNPDVSDLQKIVAEVPVSWLIPLGLLFSLVNAFAEEFLFRGLIFSALQKMGSTAAILIQAATFGCCHYHGFPRGLFGVCLAFIYGLMMGYLRHKSQGLATPWFFHIFADLTIVAILYGSIV
ncbi:MAG: CPBP family intramembrane metalloprotease [Verrucomicrobia bacterium]|nr:CPBP family intramembrane metalloprotease [Verrucomicrobiota bacterium]